MSKKTVQQEINELRSMIGQLRVSRNRGASSGTPSTRGRSRSRGRGRGRNRSRSRSRATPAAYGPGQSSSSGAMGGTMGLTTLRARELVYTVKVKANTTSVPIAFSLSPSELKGHAHVCPQLSRLAQLYEQFRFLTVRVEWEPLVGTTSAGGYILGVQPTDSRGPQDITGASYVAALQPNTQAQNYVRTALNVPKSFLKALNWYAIGNKDSAAELSNCPGFISGWCDVTSSAAEQVVARIWMTYEVEFRGFAVNT